MKLNSGQKSLAVIILALVAIISTTVLISFVARGYIPMFDKGLTIKTTGLLSAISIPKNASVYVNNKLYTTTDNAINLEPNNYQIEISKEGYLPWNKNISIQKEMVTEVQASLFKTEPKLNPLIVDNIISPTPNPNYNQIIFISPSASASLKPGIYIIETNYFLPPILNKYQPRFIAQSPFPLNDNTISFTFSPNSKQVIIKSNLKRNVYLIDLATSKVTLNTDKTTLDWDTQSQIQKKISLNKIPEIFINTIATNPATITFSGDESKFLYMLNDQYYSYDIEKKLNYLLGNRKDMQDPFWLPGCGSIIYTNNHSIKSIEFDSTNNNTIYSNPLATQLLIPQFDGQKLIISLDQKLHSLTIK